MRVPLPVSGIQLSLWRAVAIFRVVTLLVALFLIALWQPLYARAWVALLAGAGMLVVTAAVGWLALRGQAHRPAVVAGDLLLTCLLTLLTIPAQTAAQQHGGMVTLTTIWAAGPTLEAALFGGAWLGLSAGVIEYLVSVVVADTWHGRTLYSGVLLVVAGGVVGLVATYTGRAEDELRVAATAQAALAERERLARSVHDGVLQVLGLVHRTGRDAGGQWAVLAAEAGVQEAALRGLITSRPEPTAQPGTLDLALELRELRSAQVTVSTPAEPVPLAAATAGELTGAIRAALTNVAVHAGDGAHAWVLLEATDDQALVTVRDDGVGMPAGRLTAAEHEGRIGVARSVRGRVAELGGRCTITSAPGDGTLIEIAVPLGGAR